MGQKGHSEKKFHLHFHKEGMEYGLHKGETLWGICTVARTDHLITTFRQLFVQELFSLLDCKLHMGKPKFFLVFLYVRRL